MSKGSLTLLLSLALTPVLSARGGAQDELEREVKFTRLLAKNWGFIELATSNLEDLRKKESSGTKAQKLLTRLSAEVLYLGAKRLPDLNQREAALRQAIEKFEDYESRYGNEEGGAEVLVSMAEACEFFGNYLSEAIQEAKDPDKKKALEQEAVEVFTKGTRACNKAMDAYEDRKEESTDAKLNYYLSWLRKGTLMIGWAKTVQNDKEIKAKDAIQTLEDLVFDVGEETPIGMMALLKMSQTQDILGETETAIEQFKDTIVVIGDRLKDAENPVSPSTGLLLFRILEEAYARLTAIYLREGQPREAIEAVDELLKLSADFDRVPGKGMGFTYGDEALLNGAQALVDSGDADGIKTALERSRDIARRHPNDFIGLRAKNLIKSILELSSASVSPEALFQAASGDFQAGKYDSAIRGFKKVLLNLKKSEDRQTYGLKAWGKIGECFRKQGRALEACYAYMEGLRRFGGEDEKTATRMVDYLRRLALRKKKTTGDKIFQSLIDEANTLALKHGGKSRDRVLWGQAMTAMTENRPKEALRLLAQIGKDFIKFELAKVWTGIAHYEQGDFEEARKELRAYLKWKDDPYNKLSPDQIDRKQVRDSAVAQALFYLGNMTAEEAFGVGKRKGKKPERGKLGDVVRAFQGFRERYKALIPDLTITASFHLIKAFIELEQLEKAESEYKKLGEDFPKAPVLGGLAYFLFQARKDRVAAVDQEIATLAKKGPKVKDALDDARNRRRGEVLKTLAFANTYLSIERNPNYGLLRDASNLAFSIDELDQAEIFLQKILDVYGNKASYKNRIDVFIKPELAKIKLGKLEFREALKLADAGLKARPNSHKLKLLKARALGGWIDMNDKGEIQNPGGLERFEEAYKLLYSKEGYLKYIKSSKVKKYSLEWYRFQLDCLDMALKVARKGNSDYMRFARSFFNIAQQSTDEFKTLRKLGPEGEKLYRLFLKLRP